MTQCYPYHPSLDFQSSVQILAHLWKRWHGQGKWEQELRSIAFPIRRLVDLKSEATTYVVIYASVRRFLEMPSDSQDTADMRSRELFVMAKTDRLNTALRWCNDNCRFTGK